MLGVARSRVRWFSKSVTGARIRTRPPGSAGRYRLQSLVMFARSLSTMLNSGIMLYNGLEGAAVTANKREAEAVGWVRNRLKNGNPFSVALRHCPLVFPQVFVAFVEAGETGGILSEALEWAATFHEKELTLLRRTRSALIYPFFLLATALIMVTVIVKFVFPSFMPMFQGKWQNVPLLTRVVFTVVGCLENPFVCGLLLSAIAVTAFYAAYAYRNNETWRYCADLWLLRLPIVGSLVLKVNTCRFCRTLGALLGAGVDAINAMRASQAIVDNRVVAEEIARVQHRVIVDGEALDDALRESRFFPPIVIQAFTMGQETGRLDDLLQRLSKFYELEVDTAIENFTRLLEPLIIVFMGMVMGTFMLALFIPMYRLVATLNN